MNANTGCLIPSTLAKEMAFELCCHTSQRVRQVMNWAISLGLGMPLVVAAANSPASNSNLVTLAQVPEGSKLLTISLASLMRPVLGKQGI
jgi:hypothetical protein